MVQCLPTTMKVADTIIWKVVCMHYAEYAYGIGMRSAIHLGSMGITTNFIATDLDGSKTRRDKSRNSFGPGSKHPASKLNEHFITFSVVYFALN